MLVAQADPISGGAGWMGAGLLGLVLAWLLLKHLPDKDRRQMEDHQEKDKLVRELITNCDKHSLEMTVSFLGQLQQQRADFQASLTFVATESEKRTAVLVDAMRSEVKTAMLLQQSLLQPKKPGE